jgi:DmsE family decaheme c-type cytochrome
MKQWQKALAVIAASASLGILAPPIQAATDASKAAPAKNLAVDPNAKDLILKGDAKCTGCHDEADEPTGAATMLELNPSVLAIGKTKHGTTADKRTPTCTDCHGDSNDHRLHKGSGKPPKVDRSYRKGHARQLLKIATTACMTCHQKDSKTFALGRKRTPDTGCRLQLLPPGSCCKKDKVRNKVTQAEVCFTCHKEQRAQYQRPSRHPIVEGKVVCSDCHNVHGSIGPKLVKRDSTNETCYTCHMEKRGPFVRPHEPVNEDCSTCHNPHGTTAEFLLKQRPPFLCNECHSPHGAAMPQLTGQAAAATSIGRNGVNYTQGRGCVNCHTQIHGSNNPTPSTSTTPQYLLR